MASQMISDIFIVFPKSGSFIVIFHFVFKLSGSVFYKEWLGKERSRTEPLKILKIFENLDTQLLNKLM